MPRKKTATSGPTEVKNPRRSRRHVTTEDGIPQVYQDMLAEAASSLPSLAKTEGRAAKRRRLDEPPLQDAMLEPKLSPMEKPENEIEFEAGSVPPIRVQQTIYDDFSGSEDSDADFEDVDLEPEPERSDGEAESKKPLQLDLSRPSGLANTPIVQRRKPATTAEKRLRLDVHKWHVLCLMLHGYHRNRWCDNEEVQATLKPLIPRKLITLLHLDESKPQYARNHGFNKALEEIIDIWQREWTITANGIRRAFWAEDADILRDIDDLEDPVDLNDFKEAAKTMSGSRDLGAQLFCALLRSVAVDTRLVFSLQALPFSGVAKGITPEKAKQQYIYAPSTTHQDLYQNFPSSEHTALPSNPRWRASEFASREQPPRPPPLRAPSSKRHIKDSPYPIFWTEVFSPSIDKWIPVDSLVRHTFNKPRTGFEPPASDRLNSMSYVIAFEEDASARDVTRRYASQYNAKTRKLRVESTKDGEKWWSQTMKFFDRPFPETRDEIEDNEMVAREAQEGMPKSMGDFKGHPIFALKRHLKRNEVIYPPREAGKISAGVGAGAKVEPVYRRKDVHVVRSADQWYRKGRDVKEGEQPLKWASSRRSKKNTPIGEDEVSEDGTGLYAEFQTDVYVPPPAVDGKIPRNVYGNLDVYVPSMIPAGAIHLQHQTAARAARALGIDYADAVTGFDFKGRHGTAVVNGIVAGEEYREALVEVIRGIEQEQAEAEQERRTNMALQMWRRFMAALRIRNKIDKEYADAGSDEDMTDQTYDGNGPGDDGAGGGFVPDADTNELDISSFAAQPGLMNAPFPFAPSEITVIESPHKLERPALEAIPPRVASFESLFDDAEAHENGGGFLAAADHEEGGGFIPEEADDDHGGGPVPEEPTNEPSVTPPERLDAGRGFLSVSDAAPLEEGDEPPPQRPHLEVATGNPPVATLSIQVPTTAATSNGKSRLDTPEKPPALPHETSALSVKDVGSRGSPDSIDNESLLSHDPEDEDAEPEWLVDDEEL